jgi:hypothetical protein
MFQPRDLVSIGGPSSAEEVFMFRCVFTVCAAVCLLTGVAQAATCDPAAEDKKIAELVSASQNMSEKLLQDVLEELTKAEQLAQRNKMEEACAVVAKIKAMIPK